MSSQTQMVELETTVIQQRNYVGYTDAFVHQRPIISMSDLDSELHVVRGDLFPVAGLMRG